MKINHIFFDLDHTLWDFDSNSAAAYSKIFVERKIELPIEKFLNYYKAINLKYWRLYRDDKVTKEALRYGRLRDTFDFLTYKIDDQLIHALADDYLIELAKFNKLFDGTHELLTYLKSKYQLHIITNGFNEVQNTKLVNSGIKKYFDQIITSELVGFKKPNPKVFAFALNKANAKKEESMMIGDSWEADIMGAKKFGLRTIYCNFDNETVGDSIVSVTDLFQIMKIL
jgi:putative hydrolase of the HAD superfamily